MALEESVSARGAWASLWHGLANGLNSVKKLDFVVLYLVP